MRIVLVAAALLAVGACKTPEGDQPVIGGGGSGTGKSKNGPDAAVDAIGDGGMLFGRVCLVTDARVLTACAATGAGDITVTLGDSAAVTADDGTFAIAPPSVPAGTWGASRTDLMTSVVPFTSSPEIPALSQTTYADLEGNNGVLLSQGVGSVFVQVEMAGAPLAGAAASIAPASQYTPFYDGDSAVVWNQNATGAHGTVWFPGAELGNVSVSVTPAGGSATVLPSVPVADGALTFVVAAIP